MTAIGIAARTRLVLAGCVLTVLAATSTAACGGSGSGSKAGATDSGGSATTESATNPATESSGPESPGHAAGGVSVSLPSLPVGGSAADSSVTKQCVSVAWNGSQVVEGATVRVTKIAVDHPEAFVVDTGGCGTPNCAASFSFKQSDSSCFVAVRATANHGATATLTMSGTAECDTAHQDWCRQLKAGQGSITVTQPAGPPTEPTGTSTEPSPTSPTTSSPTTPTPSTTTSS